MASITKAFRGWQWNCRGFNPKKQALQQFIRSQAEKPHVILLQETLAADLPFTGYKAESLREDKGRGVAILINKKIPYIRHELRTSHCKVEFIAVEIIPNNYIGNSSSIFILNLYSSPKESRQSFKAILTKVARLAGNAPLIVGGDFNAPHQAWKYPYSTGKGERLWTHASDLSLTLITDPGHPTRCGTSTCRDSTPDLTFVRGIEKPSWVNTDIDLGSDHYIVVVSFEVVCKKLREFKLIDWDKFRKLRANPDASPDEADPPLESWIEQLGLDIHASERTILTDVGTEKMDHRLANLLEAKKSILARWKCQRLNRTLRRRSRC